MKLFIRLLAASFLSHMAAGFPALPPLREDLAARKPVEVIPSRSADFAFVDQVEGGSRASFVAVKAGHPGLSYRAEVPTRGKFPYDVETKIKTIVPCRKGDVILARFMARAPVAKQESGEGSLGFAFQLGVAPHDRSFFTTLGPGPDWVLYEIPFTVKRDFSAGEAVVALAFAELIQTVEISGLQLLNFGTGIDIAKLPQLRFTYKGREDDAAWRAAALKRIEEIRTAPLTIHVTDTAGKPITGARVEARLTQAEFIWGTSVDEVLLSRDLPDSAKYRAVLKEFFNTAVIENGYKWPGWNGHPQFIEDTRNALEWLGKEGFRQKGHNLVWPGWKFTPKWARGIAESDPAAFEKILEDNIHKKIAATKGKFISWDVINEILHERDFFPYLSKGAPVKWFQLARELDPSAKLVLNDYSMLNSAMSPGTIGRFLQVTEEMRAAGAPIDELGIQGHIGQQPRAPEMVLADLDLVAKAGLPVQITEFDINMKDEVLQADYTRDFLIACYSHPCITGFIKWGYWEPKHWKPDAAMFRKDWSEKPSAAVWRDWVCGKWNTRFDTTTPADGTVSRRGHFGKYTITVIHGGVKKTRNLTLTKSGGAVTVKLP